MCCQWFTFSCGSRVEKCLQVMITLDSSSFEREADSCFLAMWPQHVHSIDWMKVRLGFLFLRPQYMHALSQDSMGVPIAHRWRFKIPFPGRGSSLGNFKSKSRQTQPQVSTWGDPPPTVTVWTDFPYIMVNSIDVVLRPGIAHDHMLDDYNHGYLPRSTIWEAELILGFGKFPILYAQPSFCEELAILLCKNILIFPREQKILMFLGCFSSLDLGCLRLLLDHFDYPRPCQRL